MRPRRLPEAGRAEIEAIAVKRLETPTDKELAERWGISLAWVRRLMQEARERVPRGTG